MPTILIADDHDDIRKALSLRLERNGFTVIPASTGLEAIQAASASSPALILMDVNMPDLDGIEATLRLRREEKEKSTHVPIIALTAYALPGDQCRALNAGCDDFHPKPFDFDRLLNQINALISANRDVSSQD